MTKYSYHSSRYSNGFGVIGKVLGKDHFLNIPNSYLGLIFFPIMLLLSKCVRLLKNKDTLQQFIFLPLKKGNLSIKALFYSLSLSALSSSGLFLYLAIFFSFVSTVFSAYLIYVLVYILKTICLVCLPVHFINLLLFILYTFKWRTVKSRSTKRRNKTE